jgi:hypothetical protein
MRFGRAGDNNVGRELQGTAKILATSACPNPLGWICSEEAGHFRVPESHPRMGAGH